MCPCVFLPFGGEQLKDERDVENKLVVLLEYDKFPFIKVQDSRCPWLRNPPIGNCVLLRKGPW